MTPFISDPVLAIMLSLFAGLFGLLLGSFANVVIYRVPEGLSVISPRSRCGNCGHPVRSYDNIPVISWLILGGKCRDCKTKISLRYPLVELASGISFFLVTYWVFTSSPRPWFSLVSLYVFLFASIVLTMIDIDTKRLPNQIVGLLTLALFVLIGGAILSTVFSSSTSEYARVVGDIEPPASLSAFPVGMSPFESGWMIVARVIGSGLVLSGVLLLLAVIKPGGMGMGDVKFAFPMGMILGYESVPSVFVGFFMAFLLGSIMSILLIMFTSMTRKNVIPFGPWLIAGTWIGIFWGQIVFRLYLQLVGLT